jgi:hypothetical protein
MKMRRALLVYTIAAVLFIGTAHIFATHVSAREKDNTWTGFITDTHCGTKSQSANNKASNLHCIELCVQKGSRYGLLSGDKVYVLEPQTEAAKYAAESVKVTGTITDDTIRETSILPMEKPAALKQ